MTEFTREIIQEGAWHFTNPISLHPAEIHYRLCGPKGAISLLVNTNWYLPLSVDHLTQFQDFVKYNCGLDPIAICWHSPVQMADWQSEQQCDILPGGKCFGECSFSGADAWGLGLIAGGTKWLWPKLEDYYRHIFESGPAPDLTPQFIERTKS